MQAIDDETDLPLAVALARGTAATAIKIYAEPARRPGRRDHRRGAPPGHAGLGARRGLPGHAGRGDRRRARRRLPHLLAWPIRSPARPDATSRARRWTRRPFLSADNPVMAAAVRRRCASAGHDPRRHRQRLRAGTSAAAPTPRRGRRCAPARIAARPDRQACTAGVADLRRHRRRTRRATTRWPTLYEELAAPARALGMPPLEVIRAATLIGARAPAREDDMGAIAGRQARQPGRAGPRPARRHRQPADRSCSP